MSLIMLNDCQMHECFTEAFEDRKLRDARARELRKLGYEFVRSSTAKNRTYSKFIVEYAGERR